MNLHEKEFLDEGGDVKWLNGLEFIPQKLLAIYEISKILAHRPWLLTKEHIERLTKLSWSLAEVVHAIVILAHFHSLSSFVFSCGLNQDVNFEETLKVQKASQKQPETPPPDITPSSTPPFIQRLNQRMKEESAGAGCSADDNIDMLMKRMKDLNEKKKECSEMELSNRFKNVELQVRKKSGGLVNRRPHFFFLLLSRSIISS